MGDVGVKMLMLVGVTQLVLLFNSNKKFITIVIYLSSNYLYMPQLLLLLKHHGDTF